MFLVIKTWKMRRSNHFDYKGVSYRICITITLERLVRVMF